MAKRAASDPSPIRSAFLHGGLSLIVFGGLAGALGFSVNTFGDEMQAGPSETIALFDDAPLGDAPILKARLNTEQPETPIRLAAMLEPVEGPSLNVDYPESAAPAIAPREQGDAGEPSGVRINGRTVLPGQSLSQVSKVVSLPAAPVAGLSEVRSGVRLPVVADDGRQPAAVYSRPFTNPEGRPVVSLVVGGLGINRTHTRSAIDELPPEVTLSFVPYARGLQRWVNDAREAGHEVLIEMPMQPYDYGRIRPHPHTLTVSSTAAENISRMEWVLSRATGAFGVVNYQGDKFARDAGAAQPVMDALSDRGVAMIEDGSLSRSVLRDAAAKSGLTFAAANHTIDADTDANAISGRLLELELAAQKDGGAMGTGFAYPVTIDTVRHWAEGLEGKGIVLAPASALTSVSTAPQQVTALTPSAPTGADPAP